MPLPAFIRRRNHDLQVALESDAYYRRTPEQEQREREIDAKMCECQHDHATHEPFAGACEHPGCTCQWFRGIQSGI